MITGIFGVGSTGKRTIIPRDKFRGAGDHGYQTSDAMGALMRDKSVRKILGRPDEQRAFFKEIKKYGRDSRGLTVDDMRKALGTLRAQFGDSVNPYEARKLAERLIPKEYRGSKRFIADTPKGGDLPKKPTSALPF